MFLLLLALATAQPYSRSYLRGMEADEKSLQDGKLVTQAVDYILNGVLTAAKKGLTSFSVPFEGCDAFVKRGGEADHMKGVTVSRCKKVVSVIYKTVHKQLPDSSISYEGGVYTLSWD
jgi:hypothetical protein